MADSVFSITECFRYEDEALRREALRRIIDAYLCDRLLSDLPPAPPENLSCPERQNGPALPPTATGLRAYASEGV